MRKNSFYFVTILLVGVLMFTGCASAKPREKARQVNTYVSWDFHALDVGDEIPSTAAEGAGFRVVRKEDGHTWVASANPQDWAAVYFGTPDESGNEVFLKDWAVTTVMYLPTDSNGIENDGGIPILVGAAGRYDVAVSISGENSNVNVWHAGNTALGPLATSANRAKGAQVDSLNLEPGVEYTITVLGRHEGITEDGDEYFTVYVFIDDQLVVEKSGLAYWPGGFGLRGWQSAIEYKSIEVTDFPTQAPDGKDYY